LLTVIGNFLSSFGILVVLMVGGYMVIHGQTNVSTLVVFMSGFQKISDPWDLLIQYYRSLSNARVTFGLVAEVIDGTDVTASPPRDGQV
jgi:ABC-type bacteriocin/lantibiotic exporter with double-glycine peptidase domain